MKKILFSLIFISSFSFADIIGGKIADAKKYPFMVNLFVEGSNSNEGCGASIIHERFLLTAAHCLMDTTPEKVVVYPSAGTGKRNSLKHFYRAKRFYIHPSFLLDEMKSISQVNFEDLKKLATCGDSSVLKYKVIQTRNDIAIIELTEDLPFSEDINKISLSDSLPEVGSKGTVMGWGRVSDYSNKVAKSLKEAELKVVPPLKDKAFWKNRKNLSKYDNSMFGLNIINDGELKRLNDTILLDATEGNSSCQGDSGGPFVIKKDDQYVQYGVIASDNAKNPGCSGKLNALASTALHYDWIQSIVRDL